MLYSCTDDPVLFPNNSYISENHSVTLTAASCYMHRGKMGNSEHVSTVTECQPTLTGAAI
jgi:hypothetical protein